MSKRKSEVPLKKIFSLIIILLLSSLHALAVVNGEDADAKVHPEITLLILSAKKLNPDQQFVRSLRGFNVCSGAFISDRVVLTAGHCVMGPQGQQYAYLAHPKDGDYLLVAPLETRTEYKYEELQQNDGEAICSLEPKPLVKSKTIDIGLLIFPPDTAQHWHQVDFDYKPQNNQKLYYLGYGITTSPFDGGIMMLAREPILKLGQSQIWRLNSQRIGFLAKIMNSFATDGDSGGPVFIDGKIVGVINTMSEHCETQFGEDYAILNTATLLANPQTLKFIQGVLSESSD